MFLDIPYNKKPGFLYLKKCFITLLNKERKILLDTILFTYMYINQNSIKSLGFQIARTLLLMKNQCADILSPIEEELAI